MNRLTATGLAACLLVAVAGVCLMRQEAGPSAPQAEDALPKKRKRLRLPPVEPPFVGGFSGTLPPPVFPADRKGNILSLLAAGQNLEAQTAISEWFNVEPAAAATWLESQPSLAGFQPAVAQIARDMAEYGHPSVALEWAELLEPGQDREQTIYQIYATGRRYHSLSDDEIRKAPFPPAKIDALLSGAADD